tara:strand:+ start:9089 stop:9289 length:201 start_codon:yes stop_codon:yes gene_type:complete
MKILTAFLLLALASCTQGMQVLDGATHARGTAHVEGYFTDSQADVDLCKVPKEYTPEMAAAYCHPE